MGPPAKNPRPNYLAPVPTPPPKSLLARAAAVIVALENPPPPLTLISPANGATIYTSPIAVTGTVSDSLSGLAAITCNGTPATVAGTSFSCRVTLTLGANSIIAKATDLAG